LRNFYLLAGIRGAFRLRSSHDVESAGVAVLHLLDQGWGIAPPWGACDSGADLTSRGHDVLRAWTHVDLRVAGASPTPGDVPLHALLRSMWDALELFGTPVLAGVDAIVPLECVGASGWQRAAGSFVRFSGRASEQPARALVQAEGAFRQGGAPPSDWDNDAIAEALADLVEVDSVMGEVPRAAFAPSLLPNPFAYGVEQLHSAETDPFRAEVKLHGWTIDDAAWLAEAVAVSCRQAGRSEDVLIAVRIAR
jgi:hypothetical protein